MCQNSKNGICQLLIVWLPMLFLGLAIIYLYACTSANHDDEDNYIEHCYWRPEGFNGQSLSAIQCGYADCPVLP